EFTDFPNSLFNHLDPLQKALMLKSFKHIYSKESQKENNNTRDRQAAVLSIISILSKILTIEESTGNPGYFERFMDNMTGFKRSKSWPDMVIDQLLTNFSPLEDLSEISIIINDINPDEYRLFDKLLMAH